MSLGDPNGPSDAGTEAVRARHVRLRAAFLGALDLEPAERATFLERECAGDAALVAEAVELLAEADRQAVSEEVGGALGREAADLFGAARSTSPPPQRVGPYRVEREVGRGGMGVVYLARDERLGRPVALKSLPAGASRAAARARLEQEARILASLSHPHIATIHAIEEAGDRPFLVLEFVAGESLEERLARGPLPVGEALRLMTQVAQALEAAHRRGVVHRDLKPANVLVSPEGDVKVLDFGLAKLLALEGDEAGLGPRPDEGLAGTPGYMSPEQLTGGDVGRAADIWAFGCLLHECLSGRQPWPGTTAGERAAAVLAGGPDLSGLPGETPGALRALVRRCLEEEPRRRPRDIGEVLLELTSQLPAPRTPRRHSLPAERDAFVGRETELEELGRKLEGGARLLTLVGAAGMGKTRLARRLGWSVLERYPGGVWFCDLTEARSRAGIAAAVATSLDVPLGREDPVVQLGHAIAGRGSALLILDNFEQVVGEAEETLGRWLERAKDAAFVVTSRERLKLQGEEVFVLEPLAVDGAGLELFVERARVQGREFAVDDLSSDAVREAVRLLEGLPLAIELAAARIRVLSPAQIVERLKGRSGLLVGGRRAGRQTTLRAAIDWSWELLEPWEMSALAQASVFEGGFTLEAAEAVLDLGPWKEAPAVLDLVESLVDKSLLRTLAGVFDQRRFGMYVSFQEVAADRLRTQGAIPGGGSGAAAKELAEERHGRYYARFGTDDAIEGLHRTGGIERRRSLKLELDNLASACRRAAARGDGATAVAAYRAAWAVLEVCGPWTAGLELGATVSEIQGLTRVDRAALLRTWAHSALCCGLTEEARARLEAALALARQAGDRHGEAAVLGRLGNLHTERGRFEEGRDHYAQSLAIHRELGNHRHEAIVLGNLGNLHFEQGRIDEAREHYERALAIHRELGNRRFEAIALGNLGGLKLDQGRMEEAHDHHRASLAIHREIGDRGLEGVVLGNLGNLKLEQGRMEEAREDYERALLIHREIGNRRCEAIVLGNLGKLKLEQGRMEEARGHLERALAVHREMGNRRDEGIVLGVHGALHARACNRDLASDLFAEGERLLREEGDRVQLAQLLCARSEAETRAGDLTRARQCLAEAASLAAASGMGHSSLLGRKLARAREALARG